MAEDQKPHEYKGEVKMINGKKCLVVKGRVEEIVHPDGRKDVIVHVPATAITGGVNKQ